MRVRNHRLLDDDDNPVHFQRSPNQSGVIQPRYLVLHFTAGRDMDSSVAWFSRRDAKASAHLVIGRDGRITQMVAFNRKAWHAGRSQWEGISGLNAHSIGIEIDNRGKLDRRADGWGPWFDPEHTEPPETVFEAAHPNGGPVCGWQRYTQAQIGATIRASQALVAKYGLIDVLGHEDIAPGRKSAPGPAFPTQSLRAMLTGRDDDEPVPWLTTAVLNIRGGPGGEHATLDASPLPVDTACTELDRRGDWRFVEAQLPGGELKGWVHGYYLRRA